MRRTVLIATNSLFVLCAALWIGGLFGVLVFLGPAIGGAVGSPVSGLVEPLLGLVGRAGTGLVVFLLAIGVFDVLFRRRLDVKRILLARLFVVLGGVLLTVYLAYTLGPEMAMERSSDPAGRYLEILELYHQLAWLQVLTGSVALILTSVAAFPGGRRPGPSQP